MMLLNSHVLLFPLVMMEKWDHTQEEVLENTILKKTTKREERNIVDVKKYVDVLKNVNVKKTIPKKIGKNIKKNFRKEVACVC